jgi:NADH-quinone oxidoreductase subunit N
VYHNDSHVLVFTQPPCPGEYSLTILIKVFAPMVQDWREIIFWIIAISITLAKTFAIRQQNIKRLMAFSSISQAGYIMLGVYAAVPEFS